MGIEGTHGAEADAVTTPRLRPACLACPPDRRFHASPLRLTRRAHGQKNPHSLCRQSAGGKRSHALYHKSRRRKSAGIVSAADLLAAEPELPPPIIEGLLREGETANIIAAPKVGKSWLALSLALSVANGRQWLGRFHCTAGRVLLIDNELHAATLSARLRDVRDAMGLDGLDALEVMPLRGELAGIDAIAERLSDCEPGDYSLVVLDCLYRALPDGTSENDNSQIARVFNSIDAIAGRLRCGWVNIHHTSKGRQARRPRQT